MKNCLSKTLIVILCILPKISSPSDKYSPILFKTDDGIVQVSKKNVQLIGALYERYTHYIEHGLKKGSVPLLPGTSKKEVELVNRALNTRPDTFANSFLKLTKDEQSMLVSASGLWKKDQNNKIVMGLYVPDLIKRFFCTHSIDGNIYQKHIKQFWADSDDEYVLNYCKRQLHWSNKHLSLKQPIFISNNSLLKNVINLQSLFINGSCAHKDMSPIPLYIDDKQYQTYAYNFVSEFCEYRVTETPGTPATYTFWFIDHQNGIYSSVAKIVHSTPIKWCFFSKTKTDTEYIVTCSETDINFLTVTTHSDGSIKAKPVHVDIENNHKIIAAAYDHHFNAVKVVTYEDMDNVITTWQANGTFIKTNSWPFKKYGVLDQIIITKYQRKYTQMFYIFTVADMYCVYEFHPLNDCWTTRNMDHTKFHSEFDHNHNCDTYNTIAIKNDTAIVYNFWSSPFESLEPTNECHKRYSPLGNLLLRHSLKNKLGILHLETEVQDARTHKPILSIYTLHANFAGVGFSHDELSLIFLNHHGRNDTVVLGLSELAKKELEAFEKLITSNCGIASLLKHLSLQYDKTGSIVIDQKDDIYAMLTELAEHPEIGNLIKICFPINKNSLIMH